MSYLFLLILFVFSTLSQPIVPSEALRLLYRGRGVPGHPANLSGALALRRQVRASRRPLPTSTFGQSASDSPIYCAHGVPQVRNREAKKAGLEVSLFRLLSDAHPHAVVDLTEQYRMNEDIMLLSNKLIYSDRLRCGSEEVARRGLKLPDPAFLAKMHESSTCPAEGCWIERLLDEKYVPQHL